MGNTLPKCEGGDLEEGLDRKRITERERRNILLCSQLRRRQIREQRNHFMAWKLLVHLQLTRRKSDGVEEKEVPGSFPLFPNHFECGSDDHHNNNNNNNNNNNKDSHQSRTSRGGGGGGGKLGGRGGRTRTEDHDDDEHDDDAHHDDEGTIATAVNLPREFGAGIPASRKSMAGIAESSISEDIRDPRETILALQTRIQDLVADRNELESAHSHHIANLKRQKQIETEKRMEAEEKIEFLRQASQEWRCLAESHRQSAANLQTIIENLPAKRKDNSKSNAARSLRKRAGILKEVQSDIRKSLRDFRIHTVQALQNHKEYMAEVSSGILRALEGDKRNILIDDLSRRINKEIANKKQLIQELRRSRGNIRVFARIRPMTAHERKIDQEAKYLVTSNGISFDSETFDLDGVFGPQATQLEVFERCERTMESCMDGYDVCVYAYGQTNTGKTYTMEGDLESMDHAGLIFRTLQRFVVLAQKRRSVGWVYRIKVSAIEVYQESVFDLLVHPDPHRQRQNLKMFQTHAKVTIPALSWEEITSEGDITSFLKRALESRTQGKTAFNSQSSRSHAVITARIEGDHKSRKRVTGKLMMMDMAGSERIPKDLDTDADVIVAGSKMQTGSINKSISAFRGVLSALKEKRPHIPFRDSKLTTILQNAIMNKAQTIVLATLSPRLRDFEETKRSIRFSALMRNVELGRSMRHERRPSSDSTIPCRSPESSRMASPVAAERGKRFAPMSPSRGTHGSRTPSRSTSSSSTSKHVRRWSGTIGAAPRSEPRKARSKGPSRTHTQRRSLVCKCGV